jgi:hypothetical protein
MKKKDAGDDRLTAIENRVGRLWSLTVPPVLPLRRKWRRRKPRKAGKAPGWMEQGPGSSECYQWDSQEPVAFVFVPSGGGVEWWALRTGAEDTWVYDPPSSDDNDTTSEDFVPLSANTFAGGWQNQGTDALRAEGFAAKVADYYTVTYGPNEGFELAVHKNVVTAFGPY